MYKNLGALNKNSMAEKLYNMSFKTAGILIEQMDVYEKAALADEITRITESLYVHASEIDVYVFVPGSKHPIPKLSMENYMYTMGMIKRYEILLDYVYEVGKMLAADRLQEKIKETEARIAELQDELDALKGADVSSIKEKLSAASAKKDSYEMDLQANVPHTHQINDLAAALTAKYMKGMQ